MNKTAFVRANLHRTPFAITMGHRMTENLLAAKPVRFLFAALPGTLVLY